MLGFRARQVRPRNGGQTRSPELRVSSSPALLLRSHGYSAPTATTTSDPSLRRDPVLAKSESTLVPTRAAFCSDRAARVPRRARTTRRHLRGKRTFALQSQVCWSLYSARLFARLGRSRGEMALDAAVGH